MNKNSIIKKISKRSGLKKKKTERIFTSVIEMITKEISSGKEVSINGFGDFSINRQGMTIQSSKNNLNLVTPPSNKIDFIPSEIFLKKFISNG